MNERENSKLQPRTLRYIYESKYICLKIDETKSYSLYISQPDRNWIKTFDLELG